VTTDSDLADWLALLRVPGIGPVSYLRLLTHLGSPSQAFGASRRALAGLHLSEAALEHLAGGERPDVTPDLRWLEASSHSVVRLGEAGYPPRLLELSNPPPLLFVNGSPSALGWLQLAVVGSRHPTTGGADNAYHFARHLAGRGLCIGSGLALGIDAEAHKGALAADGLTVAVTATGLDRVYPPRNRDLAHHISEQGALVSELPVGTPPRAEHFPRRNRIISGLSVGTLVVEASTRSGSLITARLAAEQGREVFAIPGSIHNPLARGCHRLIREGAKLVEQADDILEELSGYLAAEAERPRDDAARGPEVAEEAHGEAYTRLLEAMGWDPVGVDQLVERSGLTAEAVSSMLLILELDGHVASVHGGRYIRRGPAT